VNVEDSIQMVILADPTGELIHFAEKGSSGESDSKIRMAAATIAATFGGAEIIGEDFKLSDPSFLIYEFQDGNLVITRCYNKTTLAILTDKNANLGTVRVLAKKYTEILNKVIHDLYGAMREEIKKSKISEGFDDLKKI